LELIFQRLEILKALALDCKVLILDEPTAVLSPQESKQLYQQMNMLTRENNLTVILITHKLKEVCQFADAATVMRSGRVVATFQKEMLSVEALAEKMIGHSLLDQQKLSQKKKETETLPCLAELKDLIIKNSAGQTLVNVNQLNLYSGECLGIAGVEGNGQTELIWALVEKERLQEKNLHMQCEFKNWPAAKNIAHIPEDRHKDGMCEGLTAEENLILGSEETSTYSRSGFLSFAAVKKNAEHIFQEFDIRPQLPTLHIGDFSGGNQQKAVVARELGKKPDMIVAAHLTRGVDIGAAQFLQTKLMQSANEGAAVVLFSSDLDELFFVSNRLFVMYEGKLHGPFFPPFSEELIGRALGGVFT
jgi:general nucleoside transport system ATP-binding protein